MIGLRDRSPVLVECFLLGASSGECPDGFKIRRISLLFFACLFLFWYRVRIGSVSFRGSLGVSLGVRDLCVFPIVHKAIVGTDRCIAHCFDHGIGL